MSTCPADLLHWASTTFAANDQCEVTARACISRAYYSSLHGAKESFNIAINPDQPSSHNAVIDALARKSRAPGQGRSSAITMVKLLPKLKRLRVKADYSLNEDIVADDVKRALSTAKVVLDCCAEAQRLRRT